MKKAFTLAEVEILNDCRVRVTEPSPVSEDKEPTKPKACRRNYPSEKKFRLVNAFTLSEVLITLGIIGVIATLTIPNLMQTIQNRDLVSKYLKVNNTLTNAYKNAEAVNGYKLYNLTPEQFKLKFEEDLKKLAGNCDNEVCLTDGSSYDYVCDEEKCTEIIVDTNGKKKPNSAGKDRFRFLISEEGIKPQGEYTDYCGEIDGGMDCGRYILANHKLFDGLVNNCSEYSNGRCSSCEDGYSLNGNSCGAVNLANCDRYSGVSCSTCKAGYMLKNGVCTSLEDNNCASTTNGETCDVCSDKYTNNNGVCEEIEIADCKTYSGDSCSECNSGQYKNNGTTCELQPDVTGCKTYVNGECTEYNTLANCDNQTNYTCNTCKNGYYLDNGQCVAQNVQNCNSYTPNANTCTECKSGYYANDGQCVAQNVANCSEYNPNVNTCKTCNSSYKLTDSKACKTPTKTYSGKTANLVGDYYVYNVDNPYSWQAASDYCEGLGMRLPTIEETTQLYSHVGETGAPSRSGTWSSTSWSTNSSCHFLRNFGSSYCVTPTSCVYPGGQDSQCSQTQTHYVTCVAKEE